MEETAKIFLIKFEVSLSRCIVVWFVVSLALGTILMHHAYTVLYHTMSSFFYTIPIQ